MQWSPNNIRVMPMEKLFNTKYLVCLLPFFIYHAIIIYIYILVSTIAREHVAAYNIHLSIAGSSGLNVTLGRHFINLCKQMYTHLYRMSSSICIQWMSCLYFVNVYNIQRIRVSLINRVCIYISKWFVFVQGGEKIQPYTFVCTNIRGPVVSMKNMSLYYT